MSIDQNPNSYEVLASFRNADPGNPALIRATAEAAIAEGRIDAAEELVQLLHDDGSAPGAARHLTGLIAMRQHRWDAAAATFDALLDNTPDGAAPIAFNAAWSHMMAGRKPAALERLGLATAEALPQAAALLVTLLHDGGTIEDAERAARHLISLHPQDRALNAAVSVLAIDIEDRPLAAATAAVAGDHPDALTTRATLILEDDPAAAERLFGDVLDRNPDSPRAMVGRGTARLAKGDPASALADLDRGAQRFATHIGSWVAAGWAHLLAGDDDTAATRFRTALEIDPNFAESHGSLAVVDVRADRPEEARRRIEIARRLDRDCFSAALAQSLLATAAGDADTARRMIELAVKVPLDGSGRTLAAALARMSRSSGG